MKKRLESKARSALESKAVLATELSSAELDKTASGLRNRAFFSAKTTQLYHLSETKKEIEEMLAGEGRSPSEIRARMKKRLEKLGYTPEKAGIQDLSSDLRTNLIIEHQEASTRGYAMWKSQQNPVLLLAYPALEMFRALARKLPRDWAARWDAARSKLGESTSATPSSKGFIALKNDPIWTAISRFNNPWPPFDFFSGMRLRQMLASKARAAGVLNDKHPTPKVDKSRIDDEQETSFPPESQEFAKAIKEAFERDGGMQVSIKGGRLVAKPNGTAKQVVPPTQIITPSNPPPLFTETKPTIPVAEPKAFTDPLDRIGSLEDGGSPADVTGAEFRKWLDRESTRHYQALEELDKEVASALAKAKEYSWKRSPHFEAWNAKYPGKLVHADPKRSWIIKVERAPEAYLDPEYLKAAKLEKDYLAQHQKLFEQARNARNSLKEKTLNALRLPKALRSSEMEADFSTLAHAEVRERLQARFDELTKCVHKEVIEQAGKGRKRVRVRKVGADRKGRAYYDPSDKCIWVDDNCSASTFTHEFGHFLEDNRDYHIQYRMNKLLDSRCGKRSLMNAKQLPGYSKGELYHPVLPGKHKFETLYMQKYYSGNVTEVLSCGVERLFENPASFIAKDPEYFDYVFATLRGTLKKFIPELEVY